VCECDVASRLLKEAADDEHYRKRFHLLFGGLLSVVGEKMREELAKQEEFVQMLSAIADKVKGGRDKEVCLLLQLFTECCNHWPGKPGMLILVAGPAPRDCIKIPTDRSG
jgi:hypothetical protein